MSQDMGRQRPKRSSKRTKSAGDGGCRSPTQLPRSVVSNTVRANRPSMASTSKTKPEQSKISSYGRVLRSNGGHGAKGLEKVDSPSKNVAESEYPKCSGFGSNVSPPPPLADDDAKENELRKFDLDPKFGPARGITRQARLQRSLKFHLIPPQLVMSILEADKENGFQKCIWDQNFSL